MRAERCSLILIGLSLILIESTEGLRVWLYPSVARRILITSARQNSRWDGRGRDRHDDHVHGGHKAENGANRRSISWRSKFVS